MRILLVLLMCHLGFAASITPREPNPSKIRIIPMPPTPEADNVRTSILFPQEGQALNNPIKVQVRLLGFPVGVMSDFDRKNEVYNDPEGQSLLVFIDNYNPFEIYRSFIDALEQSNRFYDLTLSQDIPFFLNEGMHVIRTFPDRSYGESLKNPGCFQARIFYVGSQDNNLDVDLSAPYLTYNEPLETLNYPVNRPILLDFYLSNIQLSQDGYKVRVIINGRNERTLTSWTPYYIYGLEPGKHSIRLQLLNEKNEVAPGMFNDVERTITVY